MPHVTFRGADYGLDAPGVVRGLAIAGSLALVAAAILQAAVTGRGALASLRATLWGSGGWLLATALLMVWSSRWGKLRLRDRLLDALTLAPDARVLDLGCGHGLFLIGAAKRVPRGRAVGIDLWSQVDQGGNSREATLANAANEGVADRVEVHDGDIRQLPFPDASFDAIVSSLVLHNIHGRAERRRALRELARVLRPGGQVAIVDIHHVGEYVRALREEGLQEVRAAGLVPWIFPPARKLVGRK
jgi:SAM-dependent methyltransferase